MAWINENAGYTNISICAHLRLRFGLDSRFAMSSGEGGGGSRVATFGSPQIVAIPHYYQKITTSDGYV